MAQLFSTPRHSDISSSGRLERLVQGPSPLVGVNHEPDMLRNCAQSPLGVGAHRVIVEIQRRVEIPTSVRMELMLLDDVGPGSP